MALAALLADGSLGATASDSSAAAGTDRNPLAPRPPHFPAKAKRVIFLYMDGGPSQVDTFDPKPRLTKENGQPIPAEDRSHAVQQRRQRHWPAPGSSSNYGQSGIPVSDLFPHVAQCVDDLAIVRSMIRKFSEHTSANYFLHTGSGLQGRPSMGAWATYGLGSECQELPGFVVLNGGLIPPGGLDNFSSGFLPATYQGSIFKPSGVPVANIEPHASASPGLQRQQAGLWPGGSIVSLPAAWDRSTRSKSAIANYELAYRMQTAVPKLIDMSDESTATKQLYGLDAQVPADADLCGANACWPGGWSSAACGSSS